MYNSVLKTYVRVVGGFFAILFFPSTSYALGAITFTTSPEFPLPQSQVSISASSYAVDLGASDIAWYIDGKPIKHGIGLATFEFETGEIGKKIVVQMVIPNSPQGVVKEEIVIIPTITDVLWEADTYTPPFYRGKALPTHRSKVKATVVSSAGKNVSVSPINFKWTVNRTLGLGSGVHKQSVSIETGWPKSSLPLKVTGQAVENPDLKIGGQISLPSNSPVVRFYEVTPLQGVRYAKELSNGFVPRANTSNKIKVVPYFVSKSDYLSGKVQSTWSIENKKVSGDGFLNQYLTLPENENATPQTIGFLLQNTNTERLLQKGSGTFTINTKS